MRSEPALEFACRFYDALLGRPAVPLGEALRLARQALLRRSLADDAVAAERSDWGACQRYCDPGTRFDMP